MNIEDFVDEQNKRYKNLVKPLIERKDYRAAYGEMLDIYWILDSRRREVSMVHAGMNYIGAAQALCNRLEKGDDCKNAILNFEAFAAQTKLPKREYKD